MLSEALFCVVDDDLPTTSIEVLRDACAERDLLFHPIAATEATRCTALPAGSALFNPCTSAVALAAEQALYGPGVATFHRGAASPFTQIKNPDLLLERAGVPMPSGVVVWRLDQPQLIDDVEALGGLPVVVKTSGGEGGVGIMRADTWPGLLGLLEYLLDAGHAPRIEAFVDGAMHHRVVVVGGRAVASYLNPVDPLDFRSSPSEDPADYRVGAPDELAALAIRASGVVDYALTGVDILVHPSGRAYVIEVNAPCYYPQAELVGGVSVALPMVDHLRDRASVVV